MGALELPWAKIEKGMRVELGGRTYTVEKVKPKGKRAKVTVALGGSTYTSEVKLKDVVTIARKPEPKKKSKRREPLHDERGAQARWATEKEARRGLPPGDPAVTEPPAPAEGGLWDTPATKAEKKLDRILGARLVGESLDEGAGYYVPPVDLTTVAAHWMIFHNGDDWETEGEATLLLRHKLEHEDGAPLKVNHWHTEERPSR